jgi:hypothetical protein
MRVKRNERKGVDDRKRGQNYRENDSRREGIGELGNGIGRKRG